MKVVEEGVVEGKGMVMALLFAAFDEAVDDGAAVAETVGALDVCADPLGRGFRVPVFRLRVDDVEDLFAFRAHATRYLRRHYQQFRGRLCT